MSVLFDLQNELLPILRAGDLDRCIQVASERIAAIPTTPFHQVLELQITNSPEAVAEYFDDFFRHEKKQYNVAAAYTEMNGFDINPDRWFCDAFAYDTYGGHDDYDWLSDWKSDDWPNLTITGLEPLQTVYAQVLENQTAGADDRQEIRNAGDISGFLVVLKFQRLIKRSAQLMRELSFPLLATAHDYDFIYATH